jgi:hypothetical protein
MVSSPPEDHSGPETPGERVDLSKRPDPPAEADPPIWAIGPAAAPGVPADADSAQAAYDTPPADWIPVVDETRYKATGRDIVAEIVTALVVAVVLTALGAGLAYLWAAISPRVVLEMTADGPVYTQPNPEGYVAGESVYLMMTAGVGVLAAVAVWMLARKRRGPIVLAGLAVGSVAGATLMAWLGHRIGLTEYQRLLTQAPVGTRFDVPVKVRSAIIELGHFKIQGAVLIQAMLAVALYTLLAGFYPTVSLRPERATVRFVPPHEYPPGGADEPPADTVSSGWPGPSDPQAAPAPPAGG